MQLDGFHCNSVNCSINLVDKDKAIAREDTGATGREMTVMEGQAVCKVCKEESRNKAGIV